MKLTKILGIAAVAALALTAFAGTASATTLETNGVVTLRPVSLSASLTSGTSMVLTNTSHSFGNTCNLSTISGTTTEQAQSGTTVSGPVSTLTFSGCTHEKVVVNKPGELSIEWIGTTTNGTVRSNGTSMTTPIALFGGTTNVTCTTSNTDLGTFTGWNGKVAEMDVKAVLNCGALLPSALWESTYVFTTSTGAFHAIGVVG